MTVSFYYPRQKNPLSPLYPLFHKLENRQVVVIGAGSVALRRIRRLLASGARVTVISPEAHGEITELADGGKLRWEKQPYAEGAITEADLVLTASGDHEVAEKARREAQRLGILFNSAEDEGLCDFHIPGLVDAGALKLALSSEGESPALVAAVTRQLEEWLKDRQAAAGSEAGRDEEPAPGPAGKFTWSAQVPEIRTC